MPRGTRKIALSKTDPSQPNGGNGVMALVKELWQAAVHLRGSIEPADYKRYVLPLIFLLDPVRNFDNLIPESTQSRRDGCLRSGSFFTKRTKGPCPYWTGS